MADRSNRSARREKRRWGHKNAAKKRRGALAKADLRDAMEHITEEEMNRPRIKV